MKWLFVKPKIKSFLSGVIPTVFLHPVVKPRENYSNIQKNIIHTFLQRETNGQALMYTFVEAINKSLPTRTEQEREFKRKCLEVFLQDYLMSFLKEHEILKLQSEIVKKWH